MIADGDGRAGPPSRSHCWRGCSDGRSTKPTGRPARVVSGLPASGVLDLVGRAGEGGRRGRRDGSDGWGKGAHDVTAGLGQALVAGAAAFAVLSAGAPGASAADHPKPIDWRIHSTHIGPEGEDVPLRIGQADTGGTDGFGKCHIESGHGDEISSWSTMKRDTDRGALADYLDDFRAEVADGLRQALAERGARLLDLSFSEGSDGVWTEAVIDLPGRPDPWTRRRLIVPAQGPDKDAWLAGAVFSSAVIEELDRHRPPD